MDLKTRAESLHRASKPDEYAENLSQARQEAELAKRDLSALLQKACPAGVRFTGVMEAGRRRLYCFNVETVAGTSFSIEPEYLSEERIWAEHTAALARMAREARMMGGQEA